MTDREGGKSRELRRELSPGSEGANLPDSPFARLRIATPSEGGEPTVGSEGGTRTSRTSPRDRGPSWAQPSRRLEEVENMAPSPTARASIVSRKRSLAHIDGELSTSRSRAGTGLSLASVEELAPPGEELEIPELQPSHSPPPAKRTCRTRLFTNSEPEGFRHTVLEDQLHRRMQEAASGNLTPMCFDSPSEEEGCGCVPILPAEVNNDREGLLEITPQTVRCAERCFIVVCNRSPGKIGLRRPRTSRSTLRRIRPRSFGTSWTGSTPRRWRTMSLWIVDIPSSMMVATFEAR